MTAASVALAQFDAPALATTFCARTRLRKVLALALLAVLATGLVACFQVVALIGMAINLLNSMGVFGDGEFSKIMGYVGMACSLVGMVGSLYQAGVAAMDLMAQPEGVCLLEQGGEAVCYGSMEEAMASSAGSSTLDYAGFDALTAPESCAAPWAAGDEVGTSFLSDSYPMGSAGDGYVDSGNWDLGSFDAGGTEVLAGAEVDPAVATTYPIPEPEPIEVRPLSDVPADAPPATRAATQTATRSVTTRSATAANATGTNATAATQSPNVASTAATRAPVSPYHVSGDLSTQQYVDRYMAAANGNPDAAWDLAYQDRATEGFQNAARRDAEHYLWSRQDVQSNSYQWGPSQVRTVGYSAVKVPWYYGVKAVNVVREAFGAVPIANTTQPTMSELYWGLKGSNDALFGAGN